MNSIEDKIALILEAVKVATRQESRGGALGSFQPKTRLIIVNDEGEVPYYHTQIELIYPQAEAPNDMGNPYNWDGMGKTVDEALTGNLYCLQFEFEDRLKEINDVVAKLQAAAPMLPSPNGR